jgi:hypothetical protein
MFVLCSGKKGASGTAEIQAFPHRCVFVACLLPRVRRVDALHSATLISFPIFCTTRRSPAAGRALAQS